ncbi:unnamed protein product [Paramecium primaurelia]|uniref:Uncharacterized protein n=1 Tax=Paramecium primaurelia TaxID=5886 RepID=A0A8S1QPC5_PARPR|nr:unnamed protein product [Paramecium primaurelia]
MQIRCTQADHQNQQITGFCIESTCPNQRPYCNFCLPHHGQHLNKLTSQELLYGWINERILMVQNIYKNVLECKISLDGLIHQFLHYNDFNIEQFPELGLTQIDQLIKGLCQIGDCEDKFKQLKQSIEQSKSIINEILKNIKSQPNIKQNDNLQIPNYSIEQSKQRIIFKSNPFIFDLMNQYSIKQNEWCFAIAFNKDYSILVAGCNKDIKVFQHLQGELNQIQFLSEHKNYVNTLNFMKNSNNFVSGSDDSSIIIWQMIGNNQWYCSQKLNGHTNYLLCLLVNNNDDLIISGNYDNTIKFWTKQVQWLCSQTISDHTSGVCSLSFNEQQNKLISCSHDSQILIIEQQKMDKKWIVTQKIKSDQYGIRLCFINDNQFTFQPFCKEQMHIYEMDSNTKQYAKTKEIAVKCGSSDDCCFFPQQYIKSKCILVNKNGNNVNLISRKENGDYIIQQSIEFGTYGIFGQLSDDGEYLIIWNYQSREIQIRNLREL